MRPEMNLIGLDWMDRGGYKENTADEWSGGWYCYRRSVSQLTLGCVAGFYRRPYLCENYAACFMNNLKVWRFVSTDKVTPPSHPGDFVSEKLCKIHYASERKRGGRPASGICCKFCAFVIFAIETDQWWRCIDWVYFVNFFCDFFSSDTFVAL